MLGSLPRMYICVILEDSTSKHSVYVHVESNSLSLSHVEFHGESPVGIIVWPEVAFEPV